MDPNRIWCAEQIVVHPELPSILKAFTKDAIRASPEDLLAFSQEWFRKKAGIAEGAQPLGASVLRLVLTLAPFVRTLLLRRWCWR